MRKIEGIKSDIENSKKMIAYLKECHRTHGGEDKSIYFYPELCSLYAELAEAYSNLNNNNINETNCKG